MVDSYRLALGDFEIALSFIDNTEYIIVFWFVFFIGTLVALLIILNMVIAVMGTAFTRVAEQEDAEILRAKLALIYDNFHHFPGYIVEEMHNHKYLISVDVDPEIDPIEKESMEKRLGDRIGSLEKNMGLIVESLNRNSLNLDTLYDRLSSNE